MALPSEVKSWINQFAEKDNNGKRLRQMQRAADCAAKVREVQKNRPGLSFAEAWDIAKVENPELFQSEDQKAPNPAKAANDRMSKARAYECSQTVEAVRRANPRLSFDEAWRIAEAEHRELFQP